VNVTYVLPLRWSDDIQLDELTEYLRWLSALADVVVVDGSDPRLFERHDREWAGLAIQHAAPDPDFQFANGKVCGVHTGLRRARHERVVIADDDVRYDAEGLSTVAGLLDTYDLVRPQNYFDPVPWHARWDTARTLLARAFGRDWPGTLGMRRSMFRRMGGYDGDVLFENLECVRTVRAAGGTVVSPLDLYVARRPPSASAFFSQRVRQAYDELARPWLLALWLAVLPASAIIVGVGAWMGAALLAVAPVAITEAGRRRGGGSRVFGATASLFAPLWLAERAITSWIALWFRWRHGGMPYRDTVLRRAATPMRELRRRRIGRASADGGGRRRGVRRIGPLRAGGT